MIILYDYNIQPLPLTYIFSKAFLKIQHLFHGWKVVDKVLLLFVVSWFKSQILRLTQQLVTPPSWHFAANSLASILISATSLLGRCMTTISIVRPSYKWASKHVFHSGYIVFFFWTNCVPLPANRRRWHHQFYKRIFVYCLKTRSL